MTPDPPPLPPALARLVAGLRLSSGFTLSFVTGPRDHCDSVFLRLARELQREFELVRHRLDRDGLQFFDVLSGQTDERPRLVFVTGLENMSEEERQETIVRLNLLRDSWAPHPARVVFWHPSWGLREFRDLAPDLFDWRSNLTVLHDADLPVRDEIELLVWTCERFGTQPHREGAIGLLQRVLRSPRIELVGYPPLERQVLLANWTFIAATERLARRAASSTVATHVRPSRTWRKWPDPPAPVLLRAVDAAGAFGAEDGWISLARIAHIPGPEDAGNLLDGLARRGEVVVFLEGFDRSAPETAASRLFTWLSGTSARLVALTGETSPSETPGWLILPRAVFVTTGPVYLNLPDTLKHLASLLGHMFPNPGDLHRLAVNRVGPEVAQDLLTAETPEEVAASFALACERHGVLDASLFDELRRIRPEQATELHAIERQYLARGKQGAQDMP